LLVGVGRNQGGVHGEALAANQTFFDATADGGLMSTQIRKINESIDRAQHVIRRNELVEAKFVEEAFLHHDPLAHHRRIPLPPQLERITASRRSRALFQQNPPVADIAAAARRQETSGQETRNRDKFHCPLQIGVGRGGGAG
jgi:hypothetical protein